MVGVQDITKCPKCGYIKATSEWESRGGTQWIFCGKCGYELTQIALEDKVRNEKVLRQLKRLYKQGKLVEAFILMGYEVGKIHWSKELVKTEIEERINRGFHFFKLTKDGRWIHRTKISGGWGAYHYMPTGKSINDEGKKMMVGGSGSVSKYKKGQEKTKNWLKELRTKYHMKVKMSILEGGKIKAVRI